MRYQLQITWERTRQLLEKDKIKRVQDQRLVKPMTIKVGDKVKLLRQGQAKLDPPYSGSWEVMWIDGVNVEIKNNANKEQVIHKDRLKLY